MSIPLCQNRCNTINMENKNKRYIKYIMVDGFKEWGTQIWPSPLEDTYLINTQKGYLIYYVLNIFKCPNTY